MAIGTTIIASLTGTLTPDIIAEIQAPEILQIATSLFIGGLLIVLMVILAVELFKSLGPTKSKEYRSLLTDMYVVGMVKKSAAEEKIDLIKELKEFNKLQKKKFISMQDIDSVIEDNLKEKISAKAEKETEKAEGSN